ncbi:MAG: FAD-dependent oxidoreductase [Parvibaculaceae bacterium]|nr:FAD-dependent oxidoreductase [Parvibaculaceae bacterium]
MPYEASPAVITPLLPLAGKQRKIAIIGSGVAGLGAAWLLNQSADITVFEKNEHVGGHANTVDAGDGAAPVPVDTGFIVYNEQNYPNLVALFEHLGVETKPSSMTFAASVDQGRFEYCGTGVNGLLAQRRNLINPRFWRMLRDVLRFYRTAENLAQDAECSDLSLGAYLRREKYSDAFIKDHILPMGAAIWSTSVDEMMDYPLATFVRFFKSHGLLKVKDRPEWRTVQGGSREYVKRLTQTFANKIRHDQIIAVRRLPGHVELETAGGKKFLYDDVVLATHADEALELLSDASALERDHLECFRYTQNKTYLHTDASMMPKRRAVWSSWNYLGESKAGGEALTVTYWMNRLQSIDEGTPLFVTLNPSHPPRAETILRQFDYQHPLFDANAIRAQKSLWALQGQNRTWFCGAYFGYGFHEDALQSGLAVAECLGSVKRPWDRADQNSRINVNTPTLLAAD